MIPAALDEADLALVNALQVAPRVTWARAAEILGVGAQSLAHRWERLRADGTAWVTATPNLTRAGLTMALIEVDCRPGERQAAIEALVREPRVLTVEESTQGRDLMLTVMTSGLEEMTSFVIDDLVPTPGVATFRTYLGTALHRDGGTWRLNALDPTQVAALEVEAARTGASDHVTPPDNAWPLIEALIIDGRRNAADLAAITGRNPATLRRQLPRLLKSGLLSFRCDIAQSASGAPVSCTWRCRVQRAQLDKTIKALATLPDLRLTMSTTGTTNLILTVWVPGLSHITALEQFLATKLPWMEIVDSGVNLRTTKRVGWMLDSSGRATGTVVVPTALRHR